MDVSWDGGVSHIPFLLASLALGKAGLVVGMSVHTFRVPSLCNL